MKTMQDEWDHYRTMAYPNGINGVQFRETHQAFFAGALAFSLLVEQMSVEETEDDAIKKLSRLRREVQQVCQFRADTLKERN